MKTLQKNEKPNCKITKTEIKRMGIHIPQCCQECGGDYPYCADGCTKLHK